MSEPHGKPLPSPALKPRTLNPVATRYTDYAIPTAYV
jgi:hypothetical protein